MSTRTCLQDVLRDRAKTEVPGRLLLYSPRQTTKPREISYTTLHEQAKRISRIIQSLGTFQTGRPVLLHVDDHWDTILWFWAILLADGLPVLSSPFSNVDEHRWNHIQGLSVLLESPICITRLASLHLFGAHHGMWIYPIESLLGDTNVTAAREPDCDSGYNTGSDAGYMDLGATLSSHWKSRDLALLMLTSGSTGNAKAVQLTHKQVLAAVAGKASIRSLPPDRPFLNWIGLDHVASLVEIHIQALWLGVDQVHVSAADVVSSPTTFLDLLSRHKVSRSFAPNFFLARLVSAVNSRSQAELVSTWDLSSLVLVASGGEANDVDTCVAVSSLLEKYGAPSNVIVVGFGMTETCAGAIFNLDCPRYDVARGCAVASVGHCMPGIEMRVTVAVSETSRSRLATTDEPGDLEVRGPIVFGGYYRDPVATAEAFTFDGWFRTGDQATIDLNGNLSLTGRVKDVININGVKFATADMQTSLEKILGSRVARLVVFPSRVAHTEQVTVAYVPPKWPMSAKDAVEVDEMVVQTCIVRTASHPLVFSLQKESVSRVPTSTLGKISRAKMRSLFEQGEFAHDVDLYRCAVKSARKAILSTSNDTAANESEASLMCDFADVLEIQVDAMGATTSAFDLGFTSMHLIKLKHRINERLGIAVPIVLIMKNPTVRSLAAALSDLMNTTHGYASSSHHELQEVVPAAYAYNPVVVFRSSGHKTPLWLVHPGVGEVLVFAQLAQHMHSDDRPIYALRARGFEADSASGSGSAQTRFASVAEAVDTYVGAIRRQQPHGPYALAGYSYGTMLAFEIGKRLAADTVRFLGSFNLPPHIKTRMRQLSWNMCLLHLTCFLGLHATEDFEEAEEREEFSAMSRVAAMRQILSLVDVERMIELGLDEPALTRWADVAYGLQSMAVDYEPAGQVESIDVFHAEPLRVAAASREEWVRVHLSQWQHFSQSAPRFHAVGGAHYTMIGPDHVEGFARTLQAALKARGV